MGSRAIDPNVLCKTKGKKCCLFFSLSFLVSPTNQKVPGSVEVSIGKLKLLDDSNIGYFVPARQAEKVDGDNVLVEVLLPNHGSLIGDSICRHFEHAAGFFLPVSGAGGPLSSLESRTLLESMQMI